MDTFDDVEQLSFGSIQEKLYLDLFYVALPCMFLTVHTMWYDYTVYLWRSSVQILSCTLVCCGGEYEQMKWITRSFFVVPAVKPRIIPE